MFGKCSLIIGFLLWLVSPAVKGQETLFDSCTCTQVIGFSQTASWCESFVDRFGTSRAECKTCGSWSIQGIADPDSDCWNEPISYPDTNHCSEVLGEPDCVILNVSGDRRTAWTDAIDLAVATIKNVKYPGLEKIVIQPVVGGAITNDLNERARYCLRDTEPPIANTCHFCRNNWERCEGMVGSNPDPNACPGCYDTIRAVCSHPAIAEGIGIAVARDQNSLLAVGMFPLVPDCMDYTDTQGHIRGQTQVGQNIADFYLNGTPPPDPDNVSPHPPTGLQILLP